MATLLDALRQQQQKTVNTAATGTPVGQATDQAQSLLTVKLTGKAAPVGGDVPARANTGEQIAATQSAAADTQVSQELQGKLAAQDQQSADQQQQQEIEKQQSFRERDIKKQQFDTQVTSTLADFANGQRQIQGAADIADLEQAGFGIRLNNKHYVEQLSQVAGQERIADQTSFAKQYYQQVFADQESLVSDQESFRTIMEADARTFSSMMANMDINTALDIAKNTARAEQVKGQAEAVGGLISGGAQVAGAVQASNQKQAQRDLIAKKYPGDNDKLAEFDAGLRYN